MISKITSCGLIGIDGYIVVAETDISRGMPSFDVVGLPDTAVKESRERVKAAIKNTHLEFPTKHITVNLAPANIKKEGPFYDLPICMGILCASEQLNSDEINEYMFIGELSLSGELRPVTGALPMIISAVKHGIKKVIVPDSNKYEAAVIKDAEVFPAKNLSEIVAHFKKTEQIERFTVDVDGLIKKSMKYNVDFSDVKGQENIKRALEVAAAGGHNVLIIGPPGSGKTMLAQRMPTILPPLSFEEALEVTKIHSIAGTLPPGVALISTRPFRSPHHTISQAGIAGGGRIPKPGEISLAHNGVLFLDELPEFSKDTLEVMRQPLEDGVLTIARVNATLTYPCNTMLVAAMNPCKCGYYGDATRECTCTETQIAQYLSKISGPLLDRIDLHIEASAVKYDELDSSEERETSETVRNRVIAARKIQQERFKDYPGIYSNSQMSSKMTDMFCTLGKEESAILKMAFDRLGLSARAHNRILKVARTIADLAGEENIKKEHLAEAIQYRSLDRKYR